ncbi:hypothetical protein K7W42_10790 [Deinococcus sp. HMF7604]|uniref:nucleotidyltransferase domain-containing protein n=1 Tax=Deinococcus betulae TaxID=2873312 RepID=UPI001CC8FBA7|nr:hypothetical protein [Deinococcus betulae]MBZ9751351.1 hypothetical protein [Deinococcus betulae]
MADLKEAARTLRAALGDFLERDRTEGVFHLAQGGPGAVPTLADLDMPEVHLDLLPEVPTAAQAQVLTTLGYGRAGPGVWTHPGGWRLVVCGHSTSWRAEQAALLALLRADPAAAQTYREVFGRAARVAADQALAPSALALYARTTGQRVVQQVAALLAPLNTPWMFAAGVALDLHLGEVTRPHDDVDVVVDMGAQCELLPLLEGWRLDVPVDGMYQPQTGPLQPPQHQFHARHPCLSGVLMLDVLLTDLSDGLWHYRRDPRITLPLGQARRLTPAGLPYLAPEAALLFKAGAPGREVRAKDQADFERVWPTLSVEGRTWLRVVLEQTQPGHGWLEQLG